MSDFSIRDILNNINSGNLRIPIFQRGFVWDSDSIAFLMDSIYKGYPFGTIQLWRTREALKTERSFGPFELFERDEEYPVDYILDGQQRITSIFGTFQSEIEAKDNNNPFKIYFNLSAQENAQDSQFIYLDDDSVDSNIHFPLNCLFDSKKYRKATENFDEKTIEKLDKLQEIFKEVKIPYQTLSTDDKSKVAIVFERINRKGIPLDTFQLLSAWTWNEEFNLQNKFKDLIDELSEHGFDNDLGHDMLLRIVAAILTEKHAVVEELIELDPKEIEDKFQYVINGVKGAIDFLKREFHIIKLDNLPYVHMIIPLSVFFANKGNEHFNYSDNQRKRILSWFWKTAFSRRYSSSTNKNLGIDIQEIVKLKNNKSSELDKLSVSNVSKDIFIETDFNMGTVYTKSFILLWAQNEPKSFISGGNISLANVLKEYNKHEFHHIYPKSYLDKIVGSYNSSPKCLANFCIISRADNKKISNEPPKCYIGNKMGDDVENILSATFTNSKDLKDDNYDQFVNNRAERLYCYLKELFGEI
ncbi:DUF262 domain-containing protein [Actinobacillus pleuropneumoniae]|uniref:DUF262 domain-containing protein n=1 Tax=Actinobacillus pleuropneumoniae TaxID=715 RepID=UPI002020606E|nr:DUF262 domain-containing protein [Actinobacillus pleuropneumoniae]MCL7724653.1 DUF262 domain-containing protein [Actinobacillus pleuropneumoniae]MCL7737826.1 DUF262 domain-containing protein [Actinobacillus pleuropneumoniae]